MKVLGKEYEAQTSDDGSCRGCAGEGKMLLCSSLPWCYGGESDGFGEPLIFVEVGEER